MNKFIEVFYLAPISWEEGSPKAEDYLMSVKTEEIVELRPHLIKLKNGDEIIVKETYEELIELIK